MNYGEAWLLETLAFWSLPVGDLRRPEWETRQVLNRGFHNLSPEDLVSTLKKFFERGDIGAFYDDEMHRAAQWSEFQVALDDINTRLYCGVTPTGGRRWEAMAKPDWSRYFEAVGWDDGCVEITAGSRERIIELYIELMSWASSICGNDWV